MKKYIFSIENIINIQNKSWRNTLDSSFNLK